MSAVLNRSASITPPTKKTLFPLASSTSVVKVKLPESFIGAFIHVAPHGCDTYIRFAVSDDTAPSGTLSETSTTTLSSDEPAEDADGGMKILDGSVGKFDLGMLKVDKKLGQRVWMLKKDSAGSARVELLRASGPSASE